MSLLAHKTNILAIRSSHKRWKSKSRTTILIWLQITCQVLNTLTNKIYICIIYIYIWCTNILIIHILLSLKYKIWYNSNKCIHISVVSDNSVHNRFTRQIANTRVNPVSPIDLRNFIYHCMLLWIVVQMILDSCLKMVSATLQITVFYLMTCTLATVFFLFPVFCEYINIIRVLRLITLFNHYAV